MTALPVGACVCATVVRMENPEKGRDPDPPRVRFPLHQSSTFKSVGFSTAC